jgi:hypothetical protein
MFDCPLGHLHFGQRLQDRHDVCPLQSVTLGGHVAFHTVINTSR